MIDKDFQMVLDDIKDKQATIDILLNKGAIYHKFNGTEKVYEKKWAIEILYNLGDCTIGFASCSDLEGVFPNHIHKDVHEYLICVRGSFVETFMTDNTENVRIIKTGECASIPAGMIHSSKPIDSDTKMVFICIPSDPAFSTKVENK